MRHDHGLARILVAVLTVVAGHVTDRTTNQPLTGVRVDVSGPTHARATTDANGAYRIRSVKPGRYSVTLSSPDVPPQRFVMTVRPNEKAHTEDFTACSTTLDYSCASGF